jgi:hypothetical protein
MCWCHRPLNGAPPFKGAPPTIAARQRASAVRRAGPATGHFCPGGATCSAVWGTGSSPELDRPKRGGNDAAFSRIAARALTGAMKRGG